MTAPEGEHLILFDGACGVCDRLVRFVARRDPGVQFHFASLQGPVGRAALERLGQWPGRVDTFHVIATHRSSPAHARTPRQGARAGPLSTPSARSVRCCARWRSRGTILRLPEQTRAAILARSRKDGVERIGEDLFLYVRYSPELLGSEGTMARLSSFLNQHGFNRNLAFSCLALGAALLTKRSVADAPGLTKDALTALAAGVLLTYRYLESFRQYSYEMFNVYGRAS